MKIFLDTADIGKIKPLLNIGLVDGITTNPSIIAKNGGDFHKMIKDIADLVPGPVSAEVVSLDYEGMMAEADVLSKIAQNVCIKLPITKNGLAACKSLSDRGISTNMTLCFSVPQAIMVAKLGATFVSPFVGRWDDIAEDGMALIENIRLVYDNYEFETQILAASVRTPLHFVEAARIGADVTTISPDLLEKMFDHPLTEKGIEIFMKDWNSRP